MEKRHTSNPFLLAASALYLNSANADFPEAILDPAPSSIRKCGRSTERAPRKTSFPENPAYKNQRLTEPILQKSGVFRGARKNVEPLRLICLR